jgi:hypothetical protein
MSIKTITKIPRANWSHEEAIIYGLQLSKLAREKKEDLETVKEISLTPFNSLTGFFLVGIKTSVLVLVFSATLYLPLKLIPMQVGGDGDGEGGTDETDSGFGITKDQISQAVSSLPVAIRPSPPVGLTASSFPSPITPTVPTLNIITPAAPPLVTNTVPVIVGGPAYVSTNSGTAVIK